MDEFFGSTKPNDNSPGIADADRVEQGQSPGERQWSDGIARQVLAEAVYGDLIASMPGAFTAELFGDRQSPRGRIATIIEAYVKENGSRPAPGYLDTLIERDIATQPEAVRESIADEWQYIQNTELSENAEPIYREVREWIEYQRVRLALLAAREALDSDGAEAARKILTEGTEPARASGEGFEPIDAADLIREPVKPVPWILRPMLTQDTLALLTSYPGDGKTTLVYPLIVSIARGEPFLGMTVKKTKVLILGVEESRRAIIARLRKFDVMQRDRGRIFVHPKTLKASPGIYRDVIAFMKAQDIGLLVIDTLSQFWTIENENDNAEVTQAMEELKALAHDDERCVLILHHDGKSDGVRKSRGASSLPGTVDLHLALSRVKGADKADPRRVITVEKKREPETPWQSMTIAYNGEAWRYVTEDEQPTVESPADRVVAVVTASPEGMTPAEISVATGLRGASLDRAIEEAGERLIDNGKKTRGRRYLIRPNSQEVPFGANGANGENVNDGAE